MKSFGKPHIQILGLDSAMNQIFDFDNLLTGKRPFYLVPWPLTEKIRVLNLFLNISIFLKWFNDL